MSNYTESDVRRAWSGAHVETFNKRQRKKRARDGRTRHIEVYDKSELTWWQKFWGTDSGHRGTTDFLRYEDDEKALIGRIKQTSNPEKDARILVVPGSVGAQTISIAALGVEAEIPNSSRSFKVESLDISKVFTGIAKVGAYPSRSVPRSLSKYFSRIGSIYDIVNDDIRQHMHVHEAQSFLDFEPEEGTDYSMLTCTMMLRYLSPKDKLKAIRKMIQLNPDLIYFNDLGSVIDDYKAGYISNDELNDLELDIEDAGFVRVNIRGQLFDNKEDIDLLDSKEENAKDDLASVILEKKPVRDKHPSWHVANKPAVARKKDLV